MRTAWSIKTHGKPLKTVTQMMTALWDTLEINAMLLPLKNEAGIWQMEEITNSADLERANPFTPIMAENIAPQIIPFLEKYPSEKVAALLRPCEVQALFKIDDSISLNLDNFIIFSADCLGTFPSDEFGWRSERKGTGESLTEETLHFSKYGGIAPYRYRSACQLCKNPIANQADINFNIVGVPVREQIIVSTYNGLKDRIEQTPWAQLADQHILTTHDSISEKLLYRNQQTTTRLSKTLIENTGLNLETLIDQLNTCEDCQACMQVCPMCTAFNFSRDENNKLDRETVINWMLSCIGCGMCEQACANHKPLAALFSVVNQQLQELY
ncbi:4Fe-4S dicluster domain-containing protein [bacterium]|nr:4Fe-4S dicluster domain-containing protein [bacterium]